MMPTSVTTLEGGVMPWYEEDVSNLWICYPLVVREN